MDFPDPRWAVPGIICEGVTLLCGPPKVGKSWMSLGLGLSVAAGAMAFDSIPVDGGPVLYLALEDTPRRLKTRIGKILGGQPAPTGLTLATACPPLPQGGDEAIAFWLDRHRDARMVIIDVFAKLRGASAPGASAYDADYAAVGRVKKVADAYCVAIVCVHHVRKQVLTTSSPRSPEPTDSPEPPTPPSYSSGPAARPTASFMSPAATSTKPNTRCRSNPPPAPGTSSTAPPTSRPSAKPAPPSCAGSGPTSQRTPRSPRGPASLTTTSRRPVNACSPPGNLPAMLAATHCREVQ